MCVHIHRFSMFWKLLVSCLMVRRYKALKMKLGNLLRFFIILQDGVHGYELSSDPEMIAVPALWDTQEIQRHFSWQWLFLLVFFWGSTVAKNTSSGHCPSSVRLEKIVFSWALISSAVTWVKWETMRLNSKLWGFKSTMTLGGLTSVFPVLLTRYSCLWACPLRSLSLIENPLDKHILFCNV